MTYFSLAIRALPIMTSGIPLVNSRTWFLTQSTARSFCLSELRSRSIDFYLRRIRRRHSSDADPTRHHATVAFTVHLAPSETPSAQFGRYLMQAQAAHLRQWAAEW
jgi:hypothetical protein